MILITLSEEKNSKVSNKTKKEADRIDLLLFYIFYHINKIIAKPKQALHSVLLPFCVSCAFPAA